MTDGITHGRKSMTKGLRPELQTLCGTFHPGKKDERYPDRIVDQLFDHHRQSIDCKECLKVL